MWGRQKTHQELPDKNQCGGGSPYSSPCTTQPTNADSGFLCGLAINGHHNWVPATYEGTVYWNDKSHPLLDDDYNLRLVRPDDAGVTAENRIQSTAMRKSIKLEFSSDETIDRFDTPWWKAFREAVDTGDFGSANSMITGADGNAGAFAIVTGLLGLDCPHTCASELHPVWAMAIRVKSDPSDETWAIFVRRFGNEGFCSDHQHYLDNLKADTYTFRLPWRQGASSVGVSPSTVFKSRLGQATASMSVASNQGVLISFTMAVPKLGEGEMVHGELHLRWTVPGGVVPPVVDPLKPLAATGQPLASTQAERENDEPEARLTKLIESMTPTQREIINSKLSPIPSSIRRG
jgi:hypothetical protein